MLRSLILNAKGGADLNAPAGRIYFFVGRGEGMAGRYKFITLEERGKIAAWYLRGDRPSDIAERIGVHTATVYHELQRGHTGGLDINQRPAYDPTLAQQVFQRGLKKRGRRRKLSK